MNSKKKLFAICFTALTTFVFTIAKAQPLISYNNNTFSITTPPIAQPQIPGIDPHTNVFFETGTGAFFRFSTNTPDGVPSYQQKTFTKAWNFNAAPLYPPFVQINRFYDTIRIPPHAASILNFYPVTNSNSNPSQNELAGQFLKITTSVSSPGTGISTVIPGDTMTVAITFKNSSNTPSGGPGFYNNAVIAFFYNYSDNPGIFNTIPTGNDAFFNGPTVPAIRKPIDVTILSNIDGLPFAIRKQLGNKSTGFNNVLYFSVPYNASLPERNIFLSMAPSVFPSDYTSGTSTSNSSFKAVLIDYKKVVPAGNVQAGNVNEAIQPFGIDFTSRDPNEIVTTPHCFDSLALKTNQPIDYRIHFENKGAGMAQSIIVTVSVPKGIQCRENGSNMFGCQIGTTPVPVFKEIVGPLIKFSDRRCYYRFDQSTNKIIFTIYNARLSGTVESQGINNTFGEIKFKLRTDLNDLPACMYSNVSIVFDGQKKVTDFDLIRRDCKQLINCANAEYVDRNPGR